MARLNRERFGVMNKQSYDALANMARLREKHPDEMVIGNNDFVPPMHYLFKDQWENRTREKIYLFTKKTTKKVENIDVKSLLGPVELLAPILKEDDRGYIIIPKESWNDLDDLSAYYLIQNGKFYMHICVGEHKVGYVVCDADYSVGVELLPWSPFAMIYRRQFPHNDEMKNLYPLIDGLIKDFPSLQEGDTKSVFASLSNRRILAKFKKENRPSVPALEMHAFGWSCVYMAFKAFIFLKTSEVYTQVYVPDSTPSAFRRKGFKPLNYIQVDATWDMNIDVNTPFPVRGHFVHQPCKDEKGEWTRKLIYVEQYMKKGYHRRAKKIIEKH